MPGIQAQGTLTGRSQDARGRSRRVFGGDPWPYGIEANRPTLEALIQYMVEQHFIARPIPIEDLFVVGD